MININTLLEKVKKHPDYNRAGMILVHNGVVRNSSRDGRKVSGLTLNCNQKKLDEVIRFQKTQPGIIEILVEINANKNLKVGDDVMYIVVAGDIREHVIKVLKDTLDEIKTTVTDKTQFYI